MMAARTDTDMTLKQLLAGIADAPSIVISDVAMDSREVLPGCVFLAVQGVARHGIDFAADAIANGAIAVVTDLPASDPRVRVLSEPPPVICVPDDPRLPGQIAARFFAEPGKGMNVVAVTGTNGKSTTTWLLADALRQLGTRAAVMGTIGSGAIDDLAPQALTTPDAVSVQRRVAELSADDVRLLALEASSHALHQSRLAGLDVDIAVFSNLSRDHLDYHGDMSSYFEAKAALFDVPTLKARVICTDDDWGERLWERYSDDAVEVNVLPRCARPAKRFVVAKKVEMTPAGLTIDIDSHQGSVRIQSALTGMFNVQNLLLAFAVLIAAGHAPKAAARALGAAASPPGRMQRVTEEGLAVFVDYSHTPAALAAALAALRAHTDGSLWCVFGCGGERDRGKRAEMTCAAAELADQLVLTSDNPRDEPIADIISDMRAGLRNEDVIVEHDRRRAIDYAIRAASASDCVLIAGKGHERTQKIGAATLPFDDVVEARLALRRRAERGA